MRNLFSLPVLVLFLTSCASVVDKKAFTGQLNYFNYKSGQLTSEEPMWEQKNSSQQEVIAASTYGYKIPEPSCSTMLIGVNAKGQTEEIIIPSHYGDTITVKVMARKYHKMKWEATANNPDGKAAVVKIETFTIHGDEKVSETYKENCPQYTG